MKKSSRNIYITQYDFQRLRSLINEASHTEYRGSDYIESLEKELEAATIVAPKEVPPDVITMNTRVKVLDLDSRDEWEYTLVFPEDADLEKDKISVLAPIGTAMLGYRVGDTIECKVPAGLLKLQVKEILYQPEASGDYHL
jgi:regulator of nucleoside diphosphate kinase